MNIDLSILIGVAAVFVLLILVLVVVIGRMGFYAKSLDEAEKHAAKRVNRIAELMDEAEEVNCIRYNDGLHSMKLERDVKYWKTQCNRARGKLGLIKLEHG